MRLLRYGGAIFGVLGAAGQVGFGVRQMCWPVLPNDRFNGVADVVLGLAHGAASTVTLAAIGAVVFGGASLLGACVFAGTVRAIANGLDGSRDVYNSVHGGLRADRKYGLMKMGAAAIMAAGVGAQFYPLMGLAEVVSLGVLIGQNRDRLREGWHMVRDWWRGPAGQ
jgi:hypothetical protein